MSWSDGREPTDYRPAILALAQIHRKQEPPTPKPSRRLRATLVVWELVFGVTLGSCFGQWCWLHQWALRRFEATLRKEATRA